MTTAQNIAASFAAVTITAGAFVNNADAAAVNYGTLPANTVIYTDVIENSVTDPVPLYGDGDPNPPFNPFTSGDSLVFNPVNFASFSQDGSSDITDGLLTFGIEAKPGNFIDGLRVDEAGEWTLTGGTSGTFARVTTNFFIRVIEVDGVGINPVRINAPMTITPSDGDYFADVPADLNPVSNVWEGVIDLDIKQELTDRDIDGRATKILVSLNNTLSTSSEANTVAFIQKKDFGGTTFTVIPEPTSALVLFGGALTLLTRRGRRNVA